MQITQVKNIFHTKMNDPNNDQYIGRAGHGFDGYYGNPYKIQVGESRGSTLEKYNQYFLNRLKNDKEFCNNINSLHGKNLFCFCRPKDGFKGKLLCHGQIIAAYLDGILPEQVE